MTNRRELADRLEGMVKIGESLEAVRTLLEAARLLREPVAGEVEAVTRAGMWASAPLDKTIWMMSPLDAFEAGKRAATEAIIRARLDDEGKGA